jgi:glycerate kinase
VNTVLIAPTAFKGTLGPGAVAAAMADGVRAAWPAARIITRPLSDGGNGLLEACAGFLEGALEEYRVSGPLGEPVRARLLRAGHLAVIESAEACGLHLVPVGRRDVLSSTTRGVGELLEAAVAGGAEEIVLGLGGSGTVDGGTGMARALGWRFEGADGRPIREGGGSLAALQLIRPPERRLEARVTALCDVENPLLGNEGAARVYGPQKGADARDVEILELGLARLAQVVSAQLDRSVAGLPGAGAAGGLGAAAWAFLGAELVNGASWMIERTGLGRLLGEADLVISGEGRFDVQSGMGKVTGRLIEAARAAGVPVLLVCGRLDGPTPPGVRAVDGAGRLLEAAALSELTRDACRGLATGDTL